MKKFSGFPSRQTYTPLPGLFFTEVLPEIQDISELKTTLWLFWAIQRKKGYPRFVSAGELSAETTLVRAVGGQDELRQGLALAVDRGTVLRLGVQQDGRKQDLYFLNTAADSEALLRVESGEISLGALPHKEPASAVETPSIFSLYEQNIGVLTPLIAEQLKEAEKLYPVSWIEDAFREAAELNKRSWRYISRILERWATEGRKHGEPGRYS
ncbi:MAG: DnaD domain protein [Dehalococcoidia bacterium]|nr:DnaD domain protein [Dehalococcoidia bacterium]